MVLDRLESVVEGAFDGFFGIILRGKIQPLEIARQLTRQAEEDKIISLNRVYVPNRFVVGLHPEDMAAFQAVAPELEAEFRRFVGEWVLERDYSVSGPIQVELTAQDRVRRGRVRISTSMDAVKNTDEPLALKAELPPAAVGMLEGLEGPDAGRDLPLYARRTLLGNSEACEIQLEDPQVSPKHVALEPDHGFWRLENLNGGPPPQVNGLTRHDGVVRDGDILRVGDSVFRVHLQDEELAG
ncbi:MAG: DUF3662 and FHA domain-containing protein [Armatimonadota bacterium]